MPNPLFRGNAIALVAAAVRKYEVAANLRHPHMRGRVREIALNDVIKPLLPAGFEIGTGKIVDSQGMESPEVDLVIYSSSILPPLMYSEREGVFPCEASLYAIEVKSRATSKGLDDAIRKARELRKLTCKPGALDRNGQSVSPLVVIPVFFAFSSDLRPSSSELDRYKARDDEAETKPALVAICIVGRGYWFFSKEDRRWEYDPATPEGDEVIDFVSGVVNTLPDLLASRGNPRLGLYLVREPLSRGPS